MEINRRLFAGGALAALVSNTIPAIASERSLYASTRKDSNGVYSASVFDVEAGDVVSVELPARGHDMAVHPIRQEVIAFTRRPGNFAVVFSYSSRRQPLWLKSKAGRHFYGHGVFSKDGKLLFSTENDFENGIGVIGIRDTNNGYKQVGELSSYGIGPHDLGLMPDSRTIVVANGGIRTHPDTGRQILNRAEMEPSLVYIDVKTGALLQKIVLGAEFNQLSIRHLDIAPDGTVIFGCQYKGPSHERPALIGFHKPGEKEAVMVRTPDAEAVNTRNYISSVSCGGRGNIVAATSSRGGVVMFWHIESQTYAGTKVLEDVSGVAPSNDSTSFLLTSGRGQITSTNTKAGLVSYPVFSEYSWDNHLIRLK